MPPRARRGPASVQNVVFNEFLLGIQGPDRSFSHFDSPTGWTPIVRPPDRRGPQSARTHRRLRSALAPPATSTPSRLKAYSTTWRRAFSLSNTQVQSRAANTTTRPSVPADRGEMNSCGAFGDQTIRTAQSLHRQVGNRSYAPCTRRPTVPAHHRRPRSALAPPARSPPSSRKADSTTWRQAFSLSSTHFRLPRDPQTTKHTAY